MSRRQSVFIIHTSFVSVSDLTELFHELAPEVQLRHIVDDSLLSEVLAHGKVTSRICERMVAYFKAASTGGADLIFNQCSSVGEAATLAAKAVSIPLIKVDQAMARVSCDLGKVIGVVATLPTTLGPTCRLIERTAKKMGKKARIRRCLVPGAFEALIGGDQQTHNDKVLAAIRKLSQEVDVVACAQGSMAAIVSQLPNARVPILTSPRLGVEDAVAFLRQARTVAGNDN